MAKKSRTHQITASFHYLVKSIRNDADPDEPIEEGFTEAEFERVRLRLSQVGQLDDTDEEVIAAIKEGKTLPILAYEEPERGIYFGDFEGAYYGQRYRNNVLGEIDADSLNMRHFHYLVTRLRDGKILVGVSYHGQYGDYDGLYKLINNLLVGEFRVASKTLRSIRGEIGDGVPVSLKLAFRKRADRPERRSLFGTSGVIAIRSSDFGEGFEDRVSDAARQIRGTDAQKKQAIAQIVNQADMLEIDADDIVGCSVVVSRNGRQTTIYFLGENNFSTKFPLAANVDGDGVADRDSVRVEMIRVMRNEIVPLLN